MDSGNSGSMQSSSGGDDEYDSRSDSISAFINSSTTPVLPPSQQHNVPSLFDPLSNFLDSFPRSPAPPAMNNSFLHLDAIWTRNQQSGPNCTDMGRGLMGCGGGSSSFSSPMSVSDRGSLPFVGHNCGGNINPSMQLQPESANGGRLQPPADQPTNVSRNPKKRSRASRRAPTTVLTTDTSNFRAMVQEFTGIPAPPFAPSPFPRARLDLFNTASAMRSALANPALPPYLLRPFAQKLQQQQHLPTSIFGSLPLSSSTSIASTMVDAVSSAANATNTTASINTSINVSSTGTAAAAAATSSTNNYQLHPNLGLLNQHQNLLDPGFTFQSSTPKYPFSSSTGAGFGGKPQATHERISSTGSHLKMGLLPLDDHFGLNHGNAADTQQLGGLTGGVDGSDAMSLRSSTNDPASWGDGVGSNYSNLHRLSSCKMNYNNGSTPSTDFLAEKGSENVSSRGEGMVDSWICSTD